VDLYDSNNVHGLGLIQWSFGRRVGYLNMLEKYGVVKYATAWSDTSGTYIYDNKTYDEMVTLVGQETVNSIVMATMEYLDQEMTGKYKAVSEDVTAQGLTGTVSAGESIHSALNKLGSATAAAQLFFTTMEMPGATTFYFAGASHSNRGDKAEEILTMIGGMGGNNSSLACNPEISSGGMGIVQAKAFMEAYHDVSNITTYNIHNAGCSSAGRSGEAGFNTLGNCVAFSQYFINRYTSIHSDGLPDGSRVVDRLISMGFQDGGRQPAVYAVFSISSGSMLCGNHPCGHTGVVLGIDSLNNKIVIGEASCSGFKGGGWYRAREASLSEFTNGQYTYAYTTSHLMGVN
jgi:hypothetical protein